MNKRQRKKREKITQERIKFVLSIWPLSLGRMNGKTLCRIALRKMCNSKKHRPFNLYKKKMNKIYWKVNYVKVKPNTWLGRQIIGGLDLASGKDRTVIFDEFHTPGQ